MNMFRLVLMIVLAVVIGAAVDVFTYGLRIFVTGAYDYFAKKLLPRIRNASGLSAADALAAFDNRAVSNHRAERRLIKHFAIEHAAVLEREMHQITVLGGRLWLEFHNGSLPIRGAEVNSIRHRPDSAWTPM